MMTPNWPLPKPSRSRAIVAAFAFSRYSRQVYPCQPSAPGGGRLFVLGRGDALDLGRYELGQHGLVVVVESVVREPFAVPEAGRRDPLELLAELVDGAGQVVRLDQEVHQADLEGLFGA